MTYREFEFRIAAATLTKKLGAKKPTPSKKDPSK